MASGQARTTGRDFYIIRDDLLHPVAGSKVRKFDARLPALKQAGVTDLITCGGLQSGHTAAFAAAAAEAGIRAHLLVRGEQPHVPSGYHLLSRMFGHVTYVTRNEYANRADMFQRHEEIIHKSLPAKAKIAVVPEGASDAMSLVGLIRLTHVLAASETRDKLRTIVVDSGTGTSAIGLALGAHLLQLPFCVVGVMLAGPRAYYSQQVNSLLTDFQRTYGIHVTPSALPLNWVDRQHPRKFGKVLPGEMRTCNDIARSFGVLLDPIYSLAAWEHMKLLTEGGTHNVAMLHAGGSLGLQSLAQRGFWV